MTLGEKLKTYRSNKGISQEKVAELVGVSRQAVTKWENDQTTPSSDNLMTLASIYGVSLDELVSEKQNTQKQDKKILRTNLTLIAIIAQVSFLNAAMQPFQFTDNPTMRIPELIIKFAPLLAASVWMAFNLRYEKNHVQYRKNVKIELLYCLTLAAAAMLGYYTELYFLGTLMLTAIALCYIFVMNPKYMNRQLVRKKKDNSAE